MTDYCQIQYLFYEQVSAAVAAGSAASISRLMRLCLSVPDPEISDQQKCPARDSGSRLP